ncbi:putative AP complex subunit beta protein [Naja naja]|nr:putative AP complex subunit beta protein [Naja naja]
MFLATWKDIPNDNESQFQIKDCPLSAGQDMLYQSLKLTNGICVLAELRIQPGPNFTLSLKCRAPEVTQHIFQAYETILKN